MFNNPTYICDKCGITEKAKWTTEPRWDLPEGWKENQDEYYHNCPICKPAETIEKQFMEMAESILREEDPDGRLGLYPCWRFTGLRKRIAQALQDVHNETVALNPVRFVLD